MVSKVRRANINSSLTLIPIIYNIATKITPSTPRIDIPTMIEIATLFINRTSVYKDDIASHIKVNFVLYN